MSVGFKFTKENIRLRRERVQELNNKGHNQVSISKILNVSESLISLDMQYIQTQRRKNIQSYDEKLPEEYSKCLEGLDSILKDSWIIKESAIDNREKLQALSLAKDCYNSKLELLTNVTVVKDVIKFVTSKKEKGSKNDVSCTWNINTAKQAEAELTETECEEIEQGLELKQQGKQEGTYKK
jgi:predicted transcriptional regulator